MLFALAAVVVVAFPSQVTSLVAGQKVEIIKGSKKAAAPKAKVVETTGELSPQPIVDKSVPADQAGQAALGAKEKELAQREAAVEEKEKAAAEKDQQDKSKAEKQKAQQKQIQKIGESNQKLWEKSVNALGGSTNE
ncbi:MAG: hypothetical protein U0228_23990 [Myxococcaceae bacterium]